MDTTRHARLRSLVHNINRQRRVQARKIDILCNDMIQAHRGLLERLESISFTNRIHESLVGCLDVADILRHISRLFVERFGDCSVALLLSGDRDLISYGPDTADTPAEEVARFPSFFTAENVRAVCSSNRVHLMPELLELPLQAPPRTIERFWAAAIPLAADHQDYGIVLLYSDANKPLPSAALHAACAVAPAIARAATASRHAPSCG